MAKIHNPIPFTTRLTHTIAQLKHETEHGSMDWTDTIERLESTLAEELAVPSLPEPVEYFIEADPGLDADWLGEEEEEEDDTAV